MSAATTLLRAIAATLPYGVRDRYREEWLADADGATELGLSPAGVLGGALAVAARVDRDDPMVAGMPIRMLASRRARWGIALTVVGVLLLIGSWLLGVAELAVPAVVVLVIGVAMFVRGAVLVLSMPRALAWPVAVVGSVLALASIGVAAVSVVVPAFMLLPVAGAFAPMIAFAGPAPTGRRRALLVGGLGALAVLVVVTMGLLHVLVWNPTAKLPGMTLDEIYAGLAAAGELPNPIVMVAWAAFGCLSAVGLLVCAVAPGRRLRAAASTRRVLRVSIAVVAAVALSVWVAGFGMGMGIADAFATSGGDAAGTGTVLTAVGLAGAVVSVLLALIPGPPPRPVEVSGLAALE